MTSNSSENRIHDYLNNQRDSRLVGFLGWLIMAGLIVALLKLASMNIVPYVWLVKNFGGETNKLWVEYLPVVGAMHSGWVSFVHFVAGILLWALVQILQTLWILVGLDRRAHQNALREARAARVDTTQNATEFEKQMAQKAQRIPFFFLRWSALLALAAYTFDGILGLAIFPPADNLQKFLFALGSGLTGQIDGGNVVKLLVMMFSFEVLFIPTVVIAQWLWHRNQEV